MKLMFYGLFLGLLLPVHSAMSQQLPVNMELERTVRALDLAHAEAILKGDANTLDRLMADDITVNHPTNRIINEKKELLDLIGNGVIRYTQFERRPEKFLFYRDMVVVMGDETVVPAQGAPNEGKVLRRRYTNTWLLTNGQWQLAFRHANNVCTECVNHQLQRGS